MRKLKNKTHTISLSKSLIFSMKTRTMMKNFQITNHRIAAISVSQLVEARILLANSQYLPRGNMPRSSLQPKI